MSEPDPIQGWREVADDLTAHIEKWHVRCQSAERWHWKAAAALADCKRRFNLPDYLAQDINALLAWSPDSERAFVELVRESESLGLYRASDPAQAEK